MHTQPEGFRDAKNRPQARTRTLSSAIATGADQILFSLANFALSIWLANKMSTTAFGQFNLAWTTALFLLTLHNALFTEPLLILGKSAQEPSLKNYTTLLLKATAIYCIIASAFASPLLFGPSPSNHKLWIYFATLSFSLTGLALARRALYTAALIKKSIKMGAINIALLFATLFLASIASEQTTLEQAFLALSISGTAAILYAAKQLPETDNTQSILTTYSTIFKGHWEHGKWMIVWGALSWVPLNAHYYFLPEKHGIESVAATRALFNIALPMQLLMANFNVFLQSIFSKKISLGESISRPLTQTFCTYLAIGGIFWSILILGGEYISSTIYKGKFDHYSAAIPLWGLVPIFASTHGLLGAAIKAFGRSSDLARNATYGAISAAISIPAVSSYGAIMVPIAIIFSYAVMIIPMLICYKKIAQQQRIQSIKPRNSSAQA